MTETPPPPPATAVEETTQAMRARLMHATSTEETYPGQFPLHPAHRPCSRPAQLPEMGRNCQADQKVTGFQKPSLTQILARSQTGHQPTFRCLGPGQHSATGHCNSLALQKAPPSPPQATLRLQESRTLLQNELRNYLHVGPACSPLQSGQCRS